MGIPDEPDWSAAESLLVETGWRAVESFSREHGDEVCSFFAFSLDYCYGDVVICFDEEKNSLRHAKRHEARALRDRDAMLGTERRWEDARYYLEQDRLCTYNPYTAEFKYPDFARLRFPEWEDYFLSEDLPEGPDPEGHVIVLMHRVTRRMVAAGVFDRLRMSSPFRIGAEFPETGPGLVVMGLLNWPSSTEHR